eukprot:1976525-Pleurochrysis_carterae.AAC.3
MFGSYKQTIINEDQHTCYLLLSRSGAAVVSHDRGGCRASSYRVAVQCSVHRPSLPRRPSSALCGPSPTQHVP